MVASGACRVVLHGFTIEALTTVFSCQHGVVVTPGLFSELQHRGLVHDSTDTSELEVRLNSAPIKLYVGFDPTADSLHVGHLLGQITLRRFQLAGHQPFPLAGGATGMVGDPSGRSEERNLLDRDALAHNVSCISLQLERLLDFSPGNSQAQLVNNADWTANISALDFLRDVGKHITINQMLAKESVKNRLSSENGLSYTEFSYMLLQANDFRHLCEHHGVELQMGGSDQWGNITAGIDLIRRTLHRSAFGATWPLVTKSDGTKFGKTASGAVWLDAERTSPYQFRQFWMQSTDEDAAKFLLGYSLKSIADISSLVASHQSDPGKRIAQRALADELTLLVHGADASAAALAATDILFGADPASATVDALELVAREVTTLKVTGESVANLFETLNAVGLASSNSDARRTLQQNGLRANGEVMSEQTDLASVRRLHDRYIVLRKGKSTYALLDFAP